MTAPPQRSKLLAAGLSAVVAAVALYAARPEQGGPTGPASDPASLISDQLLPAINDGDVGRYLACFTGPLRERLAAAVAEEGKASFGQALREHGRRVTGIGMSQVEIAGGEASLRLQWIYRQDADTQVIRLRRTGRAWQITEMATSERSMLAVPYGTEVIPGLADRIEAEQVAPDER